MSQRIEKLRTGLFERYTICLEKAQIITKSFQRTLMEPQVIRIARAFADSLDKITIFIEDGELIAGNLASKPRGIELSGFWSCTWPNRDLDVLKEDYLISEEDLAIAHSLNDYWQDKCTSLRGNQLVSEDISKAVKLGMLPPYGDQPIDFGVAYNSGGIGWGGRYVFCPDYEKILSDGLVKMKKEVEDELKKTKIKDARSLRKVNFLNAVQISYDAAIRFARRFAVLAQEMASREKEPERKKELLRMAATCEHVPAYPARDFYEAVQSFWFITDLLMPNSSISPGRFDQYMYPFYRKDRENGKITDEEVLELLQCLRIKYSQAIAIGWGGSYNQYAAGNVMWFHITVGGQTADGKDATNELSYLLLESALRCPTIQPTLSVRVHENTPERLMLKALELVKTGIGMPAFFGDKSYINYLKKIHSIDDRLSRDYAIVCCSDCTLPGKSNQLGQCPFPVAKVFEFFLNNGRDPKTGAQVGPLTGDFESFKSFDEVETAFKKQLKYWMGVVKELNNLNVLFSAESSPNAFASSLLEGRIKSGYELNEKPLFIKITESINPLGMINVADSLAAIKKLIFDEKKVTIKELKASLAANWKGHENLRKMCLAAPKYGNGDDYADTIARDLYQFWADTAYTMDAATGGKQIPAGFSLSAHVPMGMITGPTPD